MKVLTQSGTFDISINDVSVEKDVVTLNAQMGVWYGSIVLSDVVKLVAKVINKKLFIFPMPVAFHYVIAWICESLMNIPLVAKAQVRMLSEGIRKPLPGHDELPEDLEPQIKLTEQQILKGLPKPGGFGLKDFRLCNY